MSMSRVLEARESWDEATALERSTPTVDIDSTCRSRARPDLSRPVHSLLAEISFDDFRVRSPGCLIVLPRAVRHALNCLSFVSSQWNGSILVES